MPEFIPRLKALFASGFGYIAFLMAQIYAMVRLIPQGHAYLNPANIGQFGLRHVIAQAANNLVLKKENTDQVVIFTALLLGIGLLAMQVFMILFSVIFETAYAAPSFDSVFQTEKPEADIAFMLLDQVFGIPDLFGSCISTGATCPGAISTVSAGFPWPFHIALHEMFRFYSTGILLIGVLIFLYFVVVVVLETAATGSPFGQRFQNIWVPIRLILAIGLIVPLNYGMNSGQYITLFAAKVGSSFATNAWLTYNNVLKEEMGTGANPTGEKESLIGFPKPPDIAPLVQAMSLVHTCAFGYWMSDNNLGVNAPKPPSSGFYIKPYFVKQPVSSINNTDASRLVSGGTSYATALDFYGNGDIIIRFGKSGVTPKGPHDVVDPQAVNYKGNVIPLCGDIRIKIKDVRSTQTGQPPIGPEAVQEYYLQLVKEMWEDPEFTGFAGRYTALLSNMNEKGLQPCDFGAGASNLPSGDDCKTDPIPADWKQAVIEDYQEKVNRKIVEIWEDYIANTDQTEIRPEVLDRGWGGAGIWFNTISQLNGSFMDSIIDFPMMDQYPLVMEQVREAKRREDNSMSAINQFQPNYSSGRKIEIENDNDNSVAILQDSVYKHWNAEGQNQGDVDKVFTGDAIRGAINFIFGTHGLFAMSSENNHVHPLAQLAMLGKGLVEASIRNVATATIASAVGGLSVAIDNTPAALIEPVAKFIQSTAFVGLTAGLVLYYILPFLPFVYFYFAVGSWVKSIFEAMVGVPLWALAHLRLDGEGLPGNSAANGYFLIFEIFVRPILTVFGLVAAIAIFTAQVRVLNFLWQLVTQNLAGFNGDPTIAIGGSLIKLEFQRGVVDQLFFTIIYAIIVYMMAIAAFKLIDKIPDNILRWMGAGVSSFSDMNDDPTEGLTRYAALGGLTAGQEAAGAVQNLGGGLGRAVGGVAARTGPAITGQGR